MARRAVDAEGLRSDVAAGAGAGAGDRAGLRRSGTVAARTAPWAAGLSGAAVTRCATGLTTLCACRIAAEVARCTLCHCADIHDEGVGAAPRRAPRAGAALLD